MEEGAGPLRDLLYGGAEPLGPPGTGTPVVVWEPKALTVA